MLLSQLESVVEFQSQRNPSARMSPGLLYRSRSHHPQQVGVPCLYFFRTFVDLSLSAAERERVAEQARYEAECHKFEAYRRMGTLKG